MHGCDQAIEVLRKRVTVCNEGADIFLVILRLAGYRAPHRINDDRAHGNGQIGNRFHYICLKKLGIGSTVAQIGHSCDQREWNIPAFDIVILTHCNKATPNTGNAFTRYVDDGSCLNIAPAICFVDSDMQQRIDQHKTFETLRRSKNYSETCGTVATRQLNKKSRHS